MTTPLGIKITADGKGAVAEAGNVEKAITDIGNAGKASAPGLDKATQSINASTLSAKQLSAALRGVPAQFTDIFTSVAAGQNPMQVFLQQGGQLKDMFGGAGPAAKALGGYVAGLVNPFTVSAAAVGALAFAYEGGRRESEAAAKAIIMSGNAAGATTGQMAGLSQSIAATTGASRGAAAEVLASLVTTGNVTAANLGRIATTAVNMERIAGVAVEDTVKQFSALGQSPVEASLKLNETTGHLTASVYLQIKALEDQGRMAEAASLAQSAYFDVVDARLPRLKDNLGYVEIAWKGVTGAAKDTWDAMLGMGRQETVDEKLQQTFAKLAAAIRDKDQARIKSYQAEYNKLTEQFDAEKAAAKKATDDQAVLVATTAWEKSNQTKKQQQAKEVAALNAHYAVLAGAAKDGEAQLALAAGYRQQLGVINDKYKAPRVAASEPLGVDNAKTYASSYLALIKMQADAVAGADKLNAAEKLRAELMASGVWASMAPEWQAELNARVALTSATLDSVKADQAFQKAAASAAEAIDKSAQSLETQTRAAEAELATFGMSKSAIEDDTIARLENRRAIDASIDGSEASVEALDREIAARKRLRAAMSGIEANNAAKKFREEETKYWEKFTDDLKRNAADGLYRGLEQGGKDGGKLALEAVKRTFKAAPLKLAIDASINLVGGGLQAIFGGGSTGGTGAQGGSGIGNLFNMASSANSAFSGAASAGNFIAKAGSFLGSESIAGFGAGMNPAYASLAADGLGGYSAAGASAASAGSTLATAMPYVAAALIAYQLFAKKGGGAKTEGNYSDFSGAQMPGYGQGGALTSVAKQLTEGVEATYRDIVGLYGKTPGDLTGGAFVSTDPKGTANTQLAQTTFLNGQQVYNRVNMFGGSENVGRSEAELQAALGQSSGIAIISALEATQGLPKMVEEYLDAIDRTKLTAESAAAAINDVKLFDQIIDFAKDVNLPLDNLTSAAIKAAGGLGNVAQSLSAVAAMQRQFTDFRHQLDLGDLSTLDPLSKYREARDLYTKAIQGTDSAAVMSSANDFLQASRTAFSSSGAYAADYETVKGSLNAFQERATGAALPWTVKSTDTPSSTATADNTAATVAVLQAGLLELIEQLKAQGMSLDSIAATLGMQANNPNLRLAA